MGTDMLLYGLIDPIVDGYFPVIDRISDDIDELEDVVVGGNDRTIVDRLFHVRRRLLLIRHVVAPEREILNQLSNRELSLIAEPHRLYFRDVYDHTLRVIDELDTHRELASGVLDAYLSSVNNNLSEVMKRLTAITGGPGGRRRRGRYLRHERGLHRARPASAARLLARRRRRRRHRGRRLRLLPPHRLDLSSRAEHGSTP